MKPQEADRETARRPADSERPKGAAGEPVDATSRRVFAPPQDVGVPDDRVADETSSAPPNATGRRVYESGGRACEPEFGYYRFEEAIAELRGNLPHWRQEGVSYFVTFRLADSLPEAALERWLAERDQWLAAHPKPWDEAMRVHYHRRFTARFEKWLDAGHGSCILATPSIRAVVADSLRYFDGVRYWLDAWVVMPNHVHAIVTPCAAWQLSKILQSWKSFTAHEICKRLGDRRGPVWQKESFDHIVRGPEHRQRFRVYIARNPAGLADDCYTLSAAPSAADGEGRRGAET